MFSFERTQKDKMTLNELNILPSQLRDQELTKCCGSSAWVQNMSSIFPVANEQVLYEQAERIWFECDEEDWKEAFRHHPKIGDISSLKEKFANTSKWAEGEQAGITQTNDQVLEALADGNRLYEEKFGYIFIVCATGKSAVEMLSMLQSRLYSSAKDEIKIAMGEQNKITLIRLKKLLS